MEQMTPVLSYVVQKVVPLLLFYPDIHMLYILSNHGINSEKMMSAILKFSADQEKYNNVKKL
jgi:hypothetical protein